MENLLHEFFNSQSDASPLEASEQERLELAFEEWMSNRKEQEIQEEIVSFKDKLKAPEAAAGPLIKYLCDNYHPHVTAIVTPTSVEVLESKQIVSKIYDYLVD